MPTVRIAQYKPPNQSINARQQAFNLTSHYLTNRIKVNVKYSGSTTEIKLIISHYDITRLLSISGEI